MSEKNKKDEEGMVFEPFILNLSGEKVPAKIVPASEHDIRKTVESPIWQTDWTTQYITQKHLGRYALKTSDDETVALAAYEVQESRVSIHIMYMESHPQSNPTITKARGQRKYHNIGRALVAFGIKLSIDNKFKGDVTLDAKTTELAIHYENDFKAIPLPGYAGKAPRYLICDDAARDIFIDYLR